MICGLWLCVWLGAATFQDFRPEIEEPITVEIVQSGRTAVIRWETNYPSRSWVEYGSGVVLSKTALSNSPSPGNGSMLEFRHEAHLSPLIPQTEFCFKVLAEFDRPTGGTVQRESKSFKSVSDSSSPRTQFVIDRNTRHGPVRHLLSGISDDSTSEPVKKSFYREQSHLVNSRRLFTPFGDTAPGWDPDVPVEDRVFRFDNNSNPVYNWKRVDELFDDSLAQFSKNFVTITGMPLGLSSSKVTTGQITIRNGEADVYGVGTNFLPEFTDEVYCIHFGNENGGDNGDPWNRWHWVTEVLSPTHLRVQWPYEGETKTDIGYVMIRSNGVQSNRSTTWDQGLWEELIRRFFDHLINRYGLNKVKEDLVFSLWNEPDVYCGLSEWFRDQNTGCSDWAAFGDLYASTRRGMISAFAQHSSEPPKLGFASFGSQLSDETSSILERPGTEADLLAFHYYGHNNFFHHIDLDGMQWQWDWGAPAWGEVFSQHGGNWYEMEKHLTEVGPSIDWEHMSHHLKNYGAGFLGFFYSNLMKVGALDVGKVFDRIYLHADHIGNFVIGFGYFDCPLYWGGNTDVYFKRPMFNAIEMIAKMSGERVETARVGVDGDPFVFATASAFDNIGLDHVLLGHWKSEGWIGPDDQNHNTLEDDTGLKTRYPVDVFVDPREVVRTKVFKLPATSPYEYWRDTLGRGGDIVGDNPTPLTPQQIESLLQFDGLEVQSFDGVVSAFDVAPQSVMLVQYQRGQNMTPLAIAGWSESTDEEGGTRFYGTRSLDRDGLIDEYHWDFGDGTFADGRSVVHHYQNSGTYTVRLVVVDDDGAPNTSVNQVIVN